MEKVIVVKPIPGMLNIGDILVSPVEGADFCLEETKVTKNGSSERFVSLDYVTVSNNVPAYFTFIQDDACDNCETCDCLELDEDYIVRTDEEIQARYDFFSKQFEAADSGSEAEVVYRNLMWFIEWLQGKEELI
jgi:hypothetical protein